ncbi:hypothetical protein QS306_13940 [Paraburkholderia bonniea]|uniref:hypothetical protein n=1 Tax=Paraburkholderia bonniea TaxID=2152891 RepID=UPI001290FDCE|nr:hypothetical protein [Paraburkholderia bonniea]WJF91875.1 hypothetical protein QS306_13940 [Paraburkholderia bonniea]WJF95194.1 hypothetical protein QS308_13950 [Paraburkholderia bonniea]
MSNIRGMNKVTNAENMSSRTSMTQPATARDKLAEQIANTALAHVGAMLEGVNFARCLLEGKFKEQVPGNPRANQDSKPK